MDISIIICTYNPDTEIFKRVLGSVASLQVPDIQTELILVDNASPDSVFNRFENEIQSIPIPIVKVHEAKSGLTNARIAGYKASSGDIMVFFDDDNEPESEYVRNVWHAFKNFPNVGVFGAGNITVEFLGNPPAWIPFSKNYFQERHYTQANYACTQDWLHFYPPGTGQSMRKLVFEQYYHSLVQGKLSASDRKGNSLSSAGDVQLVFEAIKMEYAVGVHPDLRLRHLIAERKSTFTYVKRLVFGMASSYPEAYAECFPETRRVLPWYSDWRIFKILVQAFWLKIVIKKSPKSFVFLISELMGKIYASNQARGENKNSFWFSLITYLKLR
jgi:glycosyltransferase involved in cell wall biosynthesis